MTSTSSQSLRVWLRSNLPLPLVRRIQRMKDYLLWLRDGRPSPSSDRTKQKLVRGYAVRHGLQVFVETGTYKGNMVAAMRKVCRQVYSIEIDRALFERAQQKFSRRDGITLIHGDSADRLKELLPSLTTPALFWLDGHFSGGGTGRGQKDTPIMDELAGILEHPVRDHVVLIDDARLFNGTNDYPTLEELGRIVTSSRAGAAIDVHDDVICITGL